MFTLISAGAENVAEPRASYIFRPAAGGLISDASGNGFDGVAVLEADDGWVDAEVGPVLELKEDSERVELPAGVFPGKKGAVRITFRADVESAQSQYLFRVHGTGDGLILNLKEGEVDFRYFNRSSRAYFSVKRPISLGEWKTITASWDLEGERKIALIISGLPVVARVLEPGLEVLFAEENKVLLGNEHVGSAPFTGAIQSVQIFDQPIWSGEEQAAVEQEAVEIPKVARKRVLPQTLFFSRSQPKYDLFSNTLLRRWVDRPLFFDRRTEASDKPYDIVSCASFLKTQESLKAYGLDGFGSLLGYQPFQGTAFLEMLDCADAQSEKPVPLVMEVGRSGVRQLELFLPLAERALQSPNVLRVNGRILVLSYGVDGGSPEEWTALREGVRERFGDKFLFIADVTTRRPTLLREFRELGGVSAQTLEKFQAHLREWLDVSDGIMWAGGSHTNRPDGTLDRDFYRELLVPVFHGVLNEEPYREKLLGLDAEVGYVNVMTSRTVNPEEGTGRLRDNLTIALEAGPDFVTMPEWDELNENTSVGPTLTNSLSTQRIVRYFVNQFSGQENAPFAGDDVEIPNVILSFRPYIKLGEPLQFELLAIPENAQGGMIRAELSLKNLQGEVVQVFPEVSFDSNELQDHVLTIPSEKLADEAVLIPALKITSASGAVSQWQNGLESVRLLPTWNLNYKETKMPLRDMLQPEKANFLVVDRLSDGGVQVQGSIVSDEPILSVEVVQDSRELFAVDPKKELTPGPDEALVMLQWQAMRNPRLPFEGTIEVQQGKLKNFVDWTRPEYKRSSYRLTKKDDGKIHFVSDEGVNSTNARGGFFVIGNPDEAVLSMKTNQFDADFSVKDILELGKVAKVFPGGLTIEVSRLEKLPQVPHPILEKEVSFEATVHPWRADTPLQMRVVTESGKIFRSAPILPYAHEEEMVELPIWSETDQEVVRVSVSKSRIPDLAVEMKKDHDAFVSIPGAGYFHGLAGGLPFDMAAFAKRHMATAYPGSATRTSPTWVTEDGAECLKFDGKGNFLYFPEETLPRGSFALEFEIKPVGESSKPQILCTSRGYRQGALTLLLTDGELGGRWLNRESRVIPFNTGLALPQGQWSSVRVEYDLSDLVFTVNGAKRSVPIPDGMAKHIVPFIFGGYGNGKSYAWFSGFLRSFRIKHAPGLREDAAAAWQEISQNSPCLLSFNVR